MAVPVKTPPHVYLSYGRRDLLAGLTDLLGDLAAERVHAGGVAVIFMEIGEHRLQHLGGHLGRGVVVQVDGPHGWPLRRR